MAAEMYVAMRPGSTLKITSSVIALNAAIVATYYGVADRHQSVKDVR